MKYVLMNPSTNEPTKIDVSVSFRGRINHVGRGFIGLDVRGSKNMFSGIYSVLSGVLTFDLSRRKRRDVRKGINMFSVQPKIKEALGRLYVRALSKHNQFFLQSFSGNIKQDLHLQRILLKKLQGQDLRT